MTGLALARPPSWWLRWGATARGALLPVTIAIAARFLTDHQGGPALLYALLLGMVLNFLHEQPHIQQACLHCGSRGLRIGVALLGARITWAQCAELGWHTLALLTLCVVSTILVSVVIGRWFRTPLADSVVAGAAVAICGASAALAVADALTPRRVKPALVLLVVVTVTCLSTSAMVLYPAMLHAMHLEGVQAGVFLGASVHDVAQVVGAGYHMGPEEGDVASVTKMMRVALLVPAVLLIGWFFRNPAGHLSAVSAPRPWFLAGFAALVVLNSGGWLSPAVKTGLITASQFFILVAMASMGLRTSLKQLFEAGWKLPALLLLDTLFIGAQALIGVHLMW
ncbi:YeiH family protein [Aquabacterium sp. CECT 9606]|uniref:YeiH family protein n=1 Tax=Aquabacterium sp. CECT 9606 TaxID=2845822 RepID=UPI001E38176E|nr:putative sulfate exporter family transporter [Aquabacterium sp. CECT 9606]CAH0351252.1 hypothetical protein AQB9606_02000 [Aquabacterium sp. CECT 9606]